MDPITAQINRLAPQAAAGCEDAQCRLLALAEVWISNIIDWMGYFPPAGHERDDMVQEGLIGVWDALRTWREGEGDFTGFARTIAVMDIQVFMRRATRKKHRFVNDALRLDAPLLLSDDDSPPLAEALPDVSEFGADPIELVTETDEEARLLAVIRGQLTPDQIMALELFLRQGRSYREVAVMMGRTPKAVDNLVYKVRKAAAQSLAEAMSEPGWSDTTRVLVLRMIKRDGSQYGRNRRRPRAS